MDQIRIKNLRIFAYHGVYEQEKEQGQNFIVNAVLHVDMEKAGRSDDIADAVDYGAVCLFIDEYMRENRFDLLEAVAEHVTKELLFTFPAIRLVEMEIEKPNAPSSKAFKVLAENYMNHEHKVISMRGGIAQMIINFLSRIGS